MARTRQLPWGTYTKWRDRDTFFTYALLLFLYACASGAAYIKKCRDRAPFLCTNKSRIHLPAYTGVADAGNNGGGDAYVEK